MANHKSKQLSTRTLRVNGRVLIGFKYDDVYSRKKLIELVSEDLSMTINGLVYFDKEDLTKSILSLI